MKKLDRASGLKLIIAAATLELKEQELEVTPGVHHDLSNGTCTIEFPPHASVDRDAGTEGDGTNLKKDPPAPPVLELTPMALLLWIERKGETFQDWIACIRDAQQFDVAKIGEHIPVLAREALIAVAASMPLVSPKPTTCPAKCTGTHEVKIGPLKRMPKPKLKIAKAA